MCSRVNLQILAYRGAIARVRVEEARCSIRITIWRAEAVTGAIVSD